MSKKYHYDCEPSYGQDCGKPTYRVEYCEDLTDGPTCGHLYWKVLHLQLGRRK
jgi:hypothetical protein